MLLVDTIPPNIVTTSAVFNGPNQAVLVAGDQVSLTVAIRGNSAKPTASLFNTAGLAILEVDQSPYIFRYTIQPGDNGPVIFTVEAVDDAGNKAVAKFTDPSRVAGTMFGAICVVCSNLVPVNMYYALQIPLRLLLWLWSLRVQTVRI